MLDECLGYQEVVGRGNLDVLAIALDEGDVEAESFDHAGVVGETVVVGLVVGSLQQLDVEALGRLHQTVVSTRLGTLADVAEGLYDGDDGDDGFLRAGCLVAIPDDIGAGEGAHAVVDADNTLGIVGDEGQSVLYAMEARLAAVGQLILHAEIVLLAQLQPIVLLCSGQHEDDLQGGGILAEPLDGAHQDGSATNGQKLLGNVAPHAQTLAACYDNDVVTISHFSLLISHLLIR